MRRIVVVVLALAAVVIAGVLVSRNTGRETAQNTATDGTDSGEIIEARRVLMLRIEQLMKPIDAFAVEGTGDLPALRSAAGSIEAMMLAFPHLFPPATNLYDATKRESPTSALPAVWEDVSTFRTFAEASERAAATIAQSEDAGSIRTAAGALRASCDGCHALFMRAYTPPKVTQEDLDVDFDSVFQKK